MLSQEIIAIIREQESAYGDALGACVVDALMVGTRVCQREPVDRLPDCPVNRALIEAMWHARGWR